MSAATTARAAHQEPAMTDRHHDHDDPPHTNPTRDDYAPGTEAYMRGYRAQEAREHRRETARDARFMRDQYRPALFAVRERLEQVHMLARDGAPPPRTMTDAAALDELQRILSTGDEPWPSGADFIEWCAQIVTDTGRKIR